jgi:hypothetical protein
MLGMGKRLYSSPPFSGKTVVRTALLSLVEIYPQYDATALPVMP